jgi:ribonuclease HI
MSEVKTAPAPTKIEYRYYCDGGFMPNRNKRSPAYGSYVCETALYYEGYDAPATTMDRQVTLDYEHNIDTNNKAEFITLVRCLEAILQRHTEQDTIIIFMDSQTVLFSVQGKRVLKNAGLLEFGVQIKALLKQLSENGVIISMRWLSGVEMKKYLGH